MKKVTYLLIFLNSLKKYKKKSLIYIKIGSIYFKETEKQLFYLYIKDKITRLNLN